MGHPARGGEGVASVPFRTDEQITAREVTRLTGLPRRRVAEAARQGLLTTYRPPAGVGGFVRYGRASAIALGRSMVTPASANPDPTEAAPDA